MSSDELLKFLSIFAKVKNISSDWKQVIIEDSAWMIDGETSPSKNILTKTEAENKSENCENKNKKPGKDAKQEADRLRKTSKITKFI